MMFPQRSTTSRWQVSPRCSPYGLTVGSPSMADVPAGSAVGERQLQRLRSQVGAVGGARIEQRVVVPVEDREGLQQDRSLSPRPGLGDGVAAELAERRLLVA